MKKQASATRCFVCGVNNPYGLQMKFYEPAVGEVHAEITVPEDFAGYPGVVHGGIIAAMLDEVAGRVFLGDGAPRFMVTARLSVRYRRPVPVATPLVLKGQAKEDKGKVAFASGAIFNQAGDLLAEADLVLAELPTELEKRRDGVLDEWQVYPDEE